MITRACTPAILILAILPTLLRADKTEDAVVALATARAKAELAVKNAAAAVDEHRSGWASTWAQSEAIRNKTYSALETRTQLEERNPEESKNQPRIDQLQARLTKLREEADAYNARDREALNISFQDATETVGRLNQTLESLAAAEKPWKDAALDPATLQAAYEAINKKATETRQQAEKTLAAARDRQKTLQSDLDEVNALLGRSK